VFDDPLAVAMVGPDVAAEIDSQASREEHAFSRSLRAFVAARSRFAEDELARSVAAGVRQYVVLGAGLDTFAYRNPHAGLHVFEVDHPSTQQWKRGALDAAGIAIPPTAALVPVDFERQSLADGLAAAGFDSGQPAFFSWLGVVPYLTGDAFRATLAYIATLRDGSGLVFDYGVARSELPARERQARDWLSNRVAAAGEPFRLFFVPSQLVEQLREVGFQRVEDLDAAELNRRYFQHRDDGLQLSGASGHLVSAAR
jgi:methyltransferase (TIGR00027 family)